MSGAWIATSACLGCGACLRTCPEHALRPAKARRTGMTAASGTGAPIVTLLERCTGCGECMEICPADAFVEIAAECAP